MYIIVSSRGFQDRSTVSLGIFSLCNFDGVKRNVSEGCLFRNQIYVRIYPPNNIHVSRKISNHIGIRNIRCGSFKLEHPVYNNTLVTTTAHNKSSVEDCNIQAIKNLFITINCKHFQCSKISIKLRIFPDAGNFIVHLTDIVYKTNNIVYRVLAFLTLLLSSKLC